MGSLHAGLRSPPLLSTALGRKQALQPAQGFLRCEGQAETHGVGFSEAGDWQEAGRLRYGNLGELPAEGGGEHHADAELMLTVVEQEHHLVVVAESETCVVRVGNLRR